MSLENWVEKYIPLQVQARIVNTVEKLLPRDKRLKLYEINMELTEGLRETIFLDTGLSRLRHRVLNVITALRDEAQIILEQKQKRRQELGLSESEESEELEPHQDDKKQVRFTDDA